MAPIKAAATGASAAPTAQGHFEEGCKWFETAAARGELEAHYCLFVAHKSGKGVPVNPQLALRHLLAAAGGGEGEGEGAGEGEGQGQGEGEGGSPTEEEDTGMVRVRACYILGAVYETGDLGCAVDYDRAVDWWTRAAERSHPCSMVRIGVLQRRLGERAQAEKWFRLAASLGHNIPGEGEEHSH